MIKLTAFVAIIALRIMYQPSNAQAALAPFTSPSPLSATRISITPAKLISVTGSISSQKVVLNWEVNENESADQFEIEKSTDGKNFSIAALVFGTDKPDTGKYQFYEKAGNQKVLYRIKLINKNRQTEYSAVVEINPNV
ncbi:MAG: hypothetical protein SGI83_11865 [Bacteroidota bacterium]|nr:hypothetical protein [Bacteroidota bacterium]